MIAVNPSHFLNSGLKKALAVSFLLFSAFCSFHVPAAGQNDEETQKAVTYFQQGQDAHEKGDLSKAIELYKKALEIIPEFPEAEFQLGNAYLSLNKTEEAEGAFRRAIELREDWTPPIAALGSLLVGKSQYDEARRLLSKALLDEPRNPVALAALTELFLKTNVDETTLRGLLDRLTQATTSVRPTAILLSAKASVQLRLDDPRGALQSAERALSIDPQLLSAALTAANASLAVNDPEKAENYLRAIRASGRSLLESDLIAGKIAIAQGRKDAAIVILEKLADKLPEAAKLLNTIRIAGSDDLPAIEKTLESDPKNIEALGRLCEAYRTRDPSKALEYCRRANQENPREIRFAAGFAAALVQARRYEEAINLLRRLLAVDPENMTMRSNLATALFQANRLPEAKVEFNLLSERPNPAPAIYYFLAIIHDRLGEYLDAMANYQKFLAKADAKEFSLEIEKVQLRMPALEKAIKNTRRK